jgi:hypothetical protein
MMVNSPGPLRSPYRPLVVAGYACRDDHRFIWWQSAISTICFHPSIFFLQRKKYLKIPLAHDAPHCQQRRLPSLPPLRVEHVM